MRKKRLRPIYVKTGAPDWMATFADMMSLLLTFFILLFSVAEEKSEKVFEVYRSFQIYFNLDPKKVRTLGYYPTKITLSQVQGFLENSIRPPSNQGNRGRTASYREQVEKIDRFASMVEEQNHHLVEVPGEVLFEKGKASIRPGAASTLLNVAAWLRRYPDRGIKVVGHTSSLPLHPGADAPDALSLGYQRALAVARFLAGEHGDLGVMAKNSPEGAIRRLAGKIKNIDMSRITLATLGDLSPNPTRRELWENPEKDDRVEVMFLPAGVPE